MSANSEYLSTAMANYLRGSAMPTAPTTLYLALSTTEVLGTAAPDEPSAGAYARKAITFPAPTFTDSGGASMASLLDIVFPTATGSWGSITHGFISDSLTGGNVLEKWQWPVAKTIASGDTYVAAAGDITLAF